MDKPEANVAVNAAEGAAPRRQLTLFDSTCIIVGIIIGSSLYESSPMIANCAPHVWGLVGLWVLGGVLSLVGALCYAELATAYPQEGGDYVYFTRAFGRPVGFVFAWAQLWVVRPGSIGSLAYVFARYANELLPLGGGARALMIYAAGCIAVLTLVNLIGIRQGTWTQNLLTMVKVAGLMAIVVVGMFHRPAQAAPVVATWSLGGIEFGLILILLAYGGWNEMAYVAAEVRDPRRNILRSLVLGTVAVTVIYVLVTLAFVHALGFAGVRESKAVASDVMKLGLGDWGGRMISVLICISALGGINGMIFTGARITYAMGNDHRLYAWLGHWNERRGTPVWSLISQCVVTLALVIGFGWTKNGFEAMVIFETPIFWIFFFLVGVSVFVLRWREPTTPRPYRTPGYPVVPALFCLSSLFMIYSSVSWAYKNRSWEVAWSLGILAAGIALSFVSRAKPAR